MAEGGRSVVECSVEDCTSLRARREWCPRHYQRFRRHGDPLGGGPSWTFGGSACIACGSPELMRQSRKFCSQSCQVAHGRWKRGDSAVVLVGDRACITCGEAFRVGRVDGAAVARSDARRCADCRGRSRRSYRLAVDLLAYYQGNACGICTLPVDMNLRFPDPQSASVDHKIPLIAGGTSDVPNLQLAHYGCNASKKHAR